MKQGQLFQLYKVNIFVTWEIFRAIRNKWEDSIHLDNIRREDGTSQFNDRSNQSCSWAKTEKGLKNTVSVWKRSKEQIILNDIDMPKISEAGHALHWVSLLSDMKTSNHSIRNHYWRENGYRSYEITSSRISSTVSKARWPRSLQAWRSSCSDREATVRCV